MAVCSVFCNAHSEADYCFIVKDNICHLIITIKPGTKADSDNADAYNVKPNASRS